LAVLVELLQKNWPRVAGRTAVQEAELEEAERLVEQRLYAVGDRKNKREPIRKAKLVRAQAFALLTETYSQVQRAVTFLRWDAGDAEKLVPSLYKGRGRRPAKRKTNSPAAGATSLLTTRQ
jgi:hypothetical protein